MLASAVQEVCASGGVLDDSLERTSAMLARRVTASGRIAIVLALLLLVPGLASAQATIVIINNDGPGVGLNGPTPVSSVGGNTGTTGPWSSSTTN